MNGGRFNGISGFDSLMSSFAVYDKITLEDETGNVVKDGNQDVSIKLENEFGFMLEEAGVGMPADLTLTADADASFTVS